jgi:hypothetical protein
MTRRMTAEQAARNAPLAPGQAYPSVPIAESQAVQMLLGQYHGEPDSEEEDDNDDDDDDDSEDGSGDDA